MKTIILILMLLAGCDHDPIDVPRSKQRTDGAMEGPGWIETERRAVGDRVYIKSETATEIRWVEVLDRGLGRSRVMGREEWIPQ